MAKKNEPQQPKPKAVIIHDLSDLEYLTTSTYLTNTGNNPFLISRTTQYKNLERALKEYKPSLVCLDKTDEIDCHQGNAQKVRNICPNADIGLFCNESFIGIAQERYFASIAKEDELIRKYMQEHRIAFAAFGSIAVPGRNIIAQILAGQPLVEQYEKVRILLPDRVIEPK